MPTVHPYYFAALCAMTGLGALIAGSPVTRAWFSFAAVCWGVAYFVAVRRQDV